MIYFFMNVIMYLITIMVLLLYFYNKYTITSFIMILFNMNTFFIFIDKNINYLYGLLLVIISLIIYYFINLFIKDTKEIVLINKGNINFHEILNNYSYHKLINYLNKRHIKLSDVDYCIKRGNKLTVIENNQIIK